MSDPLSEPTCMCAFRPYETEVAFYTGVHLYLFVEFSLVNNDQLVPLVVDENMLVLLRRRTVLVTF